MITIGPAGIGKNPLQFFNQLKHFGLECCEVEFTYGIYMNNETAKSIKKEAKKQGITLSIHAPYYINLASEDKKKIEQSKKRIIDCCEKGHYLGAKYIVFHAAYYGKIGSEKCYELVKDATLEINKTISKNKWNIVLCPETTGKATQWGDVDEIIKLSKECGTGACIDFAHIYARNIGKIDYDEVCRKIKGIKYLTGHFTGINYGQKGERSHKKTEYERAEELLKYLKKYDINIRIINESPETLDDALMMKKILNKI